MLPVEVRAHNVRQWLDLTCQYFLELDCTTPRPHAFHSSALVARVGETLVAELHVSASRVHRRRIYAENASRAYFKLYWQLNGESRIRQGGREAVLRRGMWSIYDTSREYTIEASDHTRALMLLIPQEESRTWLPAAAALAGNAVPSGGLDRVVLASLTTLLREPSALDADSQHALQDAAVSLIERALTSRVRELGLRRPHSEATLERIRRYVRENLTDPQLTVDSLARDLGIARRTLYNLFETTGTTPRAYIQQERLLRARDMLLNPAWRDAPVSDIARFAGFADPAHFSRAFTARYGVPPGVWRARRLPGNTEELP